ncbi:MAG TPA: AAA family ATPase, partial [Parvularcula sp.]|nr:AAA family ATPase [Parvularcula sp.]
MGQSPAFLDALTHASAAAALDRPLLICGERGSGKELIAARVHFLSPRWEGPFVKLNCAALAEDLLDSELFGHEAGAFTGATRRHAGRFERAGGGTLFLDEI